MMKPHADEAERDVEMPTLLIVDDNPANIGVLVEQLEGQGYRMLVAQDGEEGLARAALVAPDLILLDVLMPGIDGFETCRRLKQDARTADIPVIFMSALNDVQDRVTGLRAGGVDFISKPFQVSEVLARIRVHLDLRQLQTQLQEKIVALELETEERRRAEYELQLALQDKMRSEQRYRALVEMAPDAILVERDGKILFANPAARSLFGAGETQELPGRLFSSLIAPGSRDDVMRGLGSAQQQVQAREEEAVRLDGATRDVVLTWVDIDFDGGPANQLVIRDVTESKCMEAQLQFQATHDGLTGLPNRTLFMDRLQQAVSAARRHGEELTVCFMDLDRFKSINDTLGHDAGDELLIEVSRRIVSSLRDADTVARLGGDEFVLLLPQSRGIEGTDALVERLLNAIARPVRLADQELHITCSLGCAHFPDDGADGTALLKRADIAMYHAKESGRNSICHYDRLVAKEMDERLMMERELRHAIDLGQLSLHYQVQTDLLHSRVVGMEALLRWQHPVLGSVPPVRFIPLAESSDLIKDITQWVIEESCRQIRLWQGQGLHTVPVAINISGALLKDPLWLEDAIVRALVRNGLDPDCLELEFTERVSLGDPERIVPVLARLKTLGVGLAIDDFGTGYSNLSYLERFAIDKLKIDGEFVRDIASESRCQSIAETIIDVAHRLNLKVVAEMVETQSQARLLSEKGCDQVQGYLVARPLPADECGALLASHSRVKLLNASG